MNRTVVIVEPGRADVRRQRNTACDLELRIPAAATSAMPNFGTIRRAAPCWGSRPARRTIGA
jgi:hypothetical protein